MRGLIALLAHPTTLRRAALASLAGNVALVITGGAVRLTGSGLGCPTWPRCTDQSYVTTAAMGVHGMIEYGNRTLTGVLTAIAALGVICALLSRPRRRRIVGLSVGVLLTIPLQAVVGGITVLTHLNPWVVACHFLVTVGIIALTYAFWMATRESDEAPVVSVPAPVRALTSLVTIVAAAVIVVGTVVTGSGPHAGDATARRTGLDPGAVSQAHADVVFLLIGLAVALWLVLRAFSGASPAARPAAVRAGWLLAIILGQGVIGFVQYATHLPALIVGAHMAGACAVWLAVLSVWYATRTRPDPVGTELRVMAGAEWAPLLRPGTPGATPASAAPVPPPSGAPA